MSKASAPASEWADLFASLSKQDTRDTIDTRLGDTPEAGPSVATVKSDNDSSEGVRRSGKPAETLDISDPGKPCVASVPSVSLESAEETSGSVPALFPTVDTSATLATEADSLDERAALVEYGANVPRRWAEGFAALSSMSAPAGFSPERWQRIIDATGTFLDRWAADAIACGWSDIDIFGCDDAAPDRRFDCMGLVLLLDRCEIVAIDGGGADLVTNTGDAQRYRRKPKPDHTVRLWDLAIAGRDAG
jgi:hypothetical protein